MTCVHLIAVETALIDAGVRETFRGQAWSENVREWVYFDITLDLARLRRTFDLPDFIEEHRHKGTHDGQEAGVVCTHCQDGVMGHHPSYRSHPTFPMP